MPCRPQTPPHSPSSCIGARPRACTYTYPPIHPPIPRPSIIPPALNYHIIPSPCVAVPHPPARTAALTCQSPIGPSVVDFGLESWAVRPRKTASHAYGRRTWPAPLRRPCTTRTTYNNNPSSHAAQTCTQPIPSTMEKRGVPVYYYSHPCSYTAHLHHGRNLPRPDSHAVWRDTNTERAPWTKPLPLRANTHNTQHSTCPALPFPSPPIADSLPPRKRQETHPEDPVCNSPQQRNPPPRPSKPTFVILIDRQFQFQFQSSPIHCTLGPSPALSYLTLSLRLPSAL
jgi:hypothetical protein